MSFKDEKYQEHFLQIKDFSELQALKSAKKYQDDLFFIDKFLEADINNIFDLKL